MNDVVISASILAMDFSKMKEQMDDLNTSSAEWIHFDVMDGHFVPNLSFGPNILSAVKKMTDKYIDVHLMVTDPKKYIPVYATNGADLITFHTEAFQNDCDEIKKALDLVHSFGIDAGIVVRPSTSIDLFESLLPYVQVVVIMSVDPGFGGQSFQYNQLIKATWLKDRRNHYNLSYRIEIDGGINLKTYKMALTAGCDTLVAGSFVFKGNIQENVKALLK